MAHLEGRCKPWVRPPKSRFEVVGERVRLKPMVRTHILEPSKRATWPNIGTRSLTNRWLSSRAEVARILRLKSDGSPIGEGASGLRGG